MNRLKELSLFKNKYFRLFLLLGFPVCLYFATELGQGQDLSLLWDFTLTRLGVVAFSVLLTTALFWVGTLMTRRAWAGGLFTALLYMTFATVDFYKTQSSGAHLQISDLLLAGNISGLSKFAKLYFSPILFGCWVVVLAWVLLLRCIDFKTRKQFRFQWLMPGAIGWITAMSVCLPGIFGPLCQVFGIDDSPSYNVFRDAERFSNNNLVSNLVVSLNEAVTDDVEQPTGYSSETVEELLEEGSSSTTADISTTEQPNIIVIMSETFADFRELNHTSDLDQYYAPLDRILAQENTYHLTTVVPTFGGGTVKTEFELLMGLPVRSLSDAYIPHQLLDDKEEIAESFASIYRDQGYTTSYVHPYYSNFYQRDEIYDRYGFDNLLFLDDLTVPAETWHNDYVTDETVFRQAEALLEQSDGPDYIHLTTMQNHMPYDTAEDGTPPYEFYLEGIEKTGQALEEFLEYLSQMDEPVIVYFTGDHFPYFSEEGNVYERTGITSENCQQLYYQSSFLWSNQPVDWEALNIPDALSSFYVPHLLYQASGLPDSAFVDTMLMAMAEEPVYSVAEETGENDWLLDVLTYDRVLGESYSQPESQTTSTSSIKKRPSRQQLN